MSPEPSAARAIGDDGANRPVPDSILADHSNDALIAAYGTNLANRLPMLYCVVIVNVVMLAFFFRDTAPGYLTVWLPACFAVAASSRAIYWMPTNFRRRDFARVKRDVVWLPVAGTVLALSLTAWALALYGYGGEMRQALVHYIVAITCFTGILGMTHSPATAITMALSVIVPSSVAFLMHDNPNRYPIIASQIVVGVLLIIITRGHHRDFVGWNCRARTSPGASGSPPSGPGTIASRRRATP